MLVSDSHTSDITDCYSLHLNFRRRELEVSQNIRSNPSLQIPISAADDTIATHDLHHEYQIWLFAITETPIIITRKTGRLLKSFVSSSIKLFYDQ